MVAVQPIAVVQMAVELVHAAELIAQKLVNLALVGLQWMCSSIGMIRVHCVGNTMNLQNYFSPQNDRLQLSDLETHFKR